MRRLLDAFAFGGAVIGSAIIAFNLGFNQIGYAFFLVSSISSVLLLKNSNASRSLLLTNLFFVVMNVIGLIRY